MRGSGFERLTALAALVAAACAGGSSRRQSQARSLPAPVVVPTPPVPGALEAPDAGSVDAAPVLDDPLVHRIEIVLRPASKPCTLLVRSAIFEDTTDYWMLGAVSHLATEQSAGCAAGVLFDPSVEVVPEGEEPTEALEAGAMAKPGGRELSGEIPEGAVLADYDFDGSLDLCVKQSFGAYNFSQRCWLFDPTARRFVRNAELETMQNIEIDVSKRMLASSWRVGGPVYTAVQKRWIDGKLVTIREVLTHLGETPSGKPLPPGKSSWEVVSVRRGGKLVKQSEGPR